MKVIILAAGVGKRFGAKHPKALIQLENRETILHHQINALLQYLELNEILIILGYKKKLILNEFPNINYLVNHKYLQTNTSKSLLLGLNKLIGDDDILWLNGDVYFEQQVLDRIINYSGNCMAVNKEKVGDEEVKYKTNKYGFISEISKKVDEPEGESLGIHKINKDEVKQMIEYLSICNDNDYFEKGIELAILAGMKIQPINISDLTCVEIDFPEDLKGLNNKLKKSKNHN